jgi:hypothetical protein
MPRRTLDCETVCPSLCKLRKDELVGLLHEAFHAMPAARRVSVFGEYAPSDPSKTSPARVEYVESATDLIQEHASSDREKLLGAARRVANPEQRRALRSKSASNAKAKRVRA